MERTQLWAAPEATENDSRDYLQDPQLWIDRLPQPFRMVDDLLQELLERSWQAVEARERQIERERARGRIAEVVAEGTFGGVQNVLAVSEGRDGRVVFVGCGDAVRVAVEGDSGPACVTHSHTESAVISLAVEQIEDVHVVAACTESGSVLLFASLLSGIKLIQLAEITQQEEGRKAVAALLSASCSHVVITTHSCDTGYKILCYHLPATAWLEELATYREETTATSSENEGEGREPQAHSKPSLVFTINPPKAPAPCTAGSHHAVLLNAGRDGVATGENHMLTELYFKNRRRTFEAQRVGFTQEPPPHTLGQRVPTCHFLYFKNGIKLDDPCCLAVWWTSHTQLLLYSLTSKGSTSVLEQVLPQASTICVTNISRDGRSLAVGLASGVVIMWNLKTNFCCGVQQVVRGSESITALMFHPKSEGLPLLAVGTDRGTVILMKSDNLTSLNHRVSQQQGVGQPQFFSSHHDCPKVAGFSHCSGLPLVLLSLHVDGTVILWNTTVLEPLCRVLPPPSLSSSPPLCAISGSYLFITAQRRELEAKFPAVGLHYLNLSLVKHLQQHCIASSSNICSVKSTPATVMDIVENKLMESTVKLFAESELFEARRTARWTQFAEHLHAE